MGEQHELDALIERIDRTDFGAQETALVRQALALASQGGDAGREYRVRLRAMLSAAHHARFEEFLEHFVYCLEHHRSDPRRFPEEDGGISVRAYQPRAVRSLMNRLAAPVESLEAVLADFEEHLQRSGSSPRKAWEIRVDLEAYRGRTQRAREVLRGIAELERPEGEWCGGCEAVQAGELELLEGRPAAFVELVDQLGEHTPQCPNSELRLAALSVLPLAGAGRVEEALDLHRWGSRAGRRAGLSAGAEVARHAAFAALASHPERALDLARSVLAGRAPGDSTERKRFETTQWLELALVVAQDEGWGEALLPGAAEWVPAAAGGTPTVAQAADAVAALTTEVAQRLDDHFGGEVFRASLGRTRALRATRVSVPWAEHAPDLAPSGLGTARGRGPANADGATLPDAGVPGTAQTAGEREGNQADGAQGFASPGGDAHSADASDAASNAAREASARGEAPTTGSAGAPTRTQQDWLDAVALPALMDDSERAGEAMAAAIAAIQDPSIALELFSEAIDVLSEQAPRWYEERAKRFEAVGMLDHARLETELRDLMVASRDAEPADVLRWREALEWLTTDAARAEVLIHLAHALAAGGEDEEAADTAAQAAELALSMPARSDVLWVLGEAASTALAVGRGEEALRYSDAGAELALVGETNALVWMHQRGLILSDLGRDEEAVSFLKRAADVALKHELWPVAVHLLMQAGGRAYYADLNVQASAYLRLGRDAAIRGKDHREGLMTQRLAAALEDAGEPDEAASLMTGLLARFEADPDHPALGELNVRSLQRGLGDALFAAGDRNGAEAAWRAALEGGRPEFEAAMAAFEVGQAPALNPSELREAASDVGNCAFGVARLLAGRDELDDVAGLARLGAETSEFSHAGAPAVRAELLETAAQLLSRAEEHAEALALAEQARELYLQEDQAHAAADSLDTRGRILGAMGRTEEAFETLLRAADEFQRLAAAPNAALSLWLAGQLAEQAEQRLSTLARAWELLGEEHGGLRARVGESYAEALAEGGREAEADAVRGMIE